MSKSLHVSDEIKPEPRLEKLQFCGEKFNFNELTKDLEKKVPKNSQSNPPRKKDSSISKN